MAIRTIQVNLSADISNFQQNISRAERSIGSLGSELNNNMRRISSNTQLMLAQLGNNASVMDTLRVRATGLNNSLGQQSLYVSRLQNELNSARNNFGATSTQVRNLELQLLRAATAEQTMRNELARLNQEMSTAARLSRFGNDMRAQGQNTMQAGAGITAGITVPVTLGLKKGIDYNAFMQENQISFETLLGDAKKAQDLMKKIEKMAVKTPFETSDLTQQAKILLNYGVSLENTLPLLNRLGDASLGNAEKMKSLTYAFSQIYARGKLTGDNLRQLTEAGFNPLQEMSKKTGKSVSQLTDMMEKSQISVQDVTNALIDATSSGGRFFNAMEKQSQTFSGRLSTLRDNINITLGELTKPIFDTLTNSVLPRLIGLMEMLKNMFNSLSPFWKSFISYGILAVAAIGPLAILIGSATWAIGTLSTALATAITFMRGLSLASVLLAGKILLAAAAGVALGAVAFVVKENWDEVKNYLSNLWDYIKIGFSLAGYEVAQTFLNLKTKIFETLDSLANAFSKLPGMGDKFVGISGATREAYRQQQQMTQEVVGLLKKSDQLKAKLDSSGKSTLDSMRKTVNDTMNGFKDMFKAPELTDLMGKTKIGAITDIPFLDAVQDKTKGSAKKIEDELKSFVDKVKSQAESFKNALGLFDKATTEKLSGETLLARLKGQLNILSGWKSALGNLQGKLGAGSALFQDLLQRGPQAAGQIVALSRLSDTKLGEYNRLYGDKSMLTSGIASQAVSMQMMEEKKVSQVVIQIQNAYGDGVEELANKITEKLRMAGVY